MYLYKVYVFNGNALLIYPAYCFLVLLNIDFGIVHEYSGL